MSMTFTKLFSSITESTIWVAPDHHRLTWIAMLAMADHAGRVWGSIPGLANRARVPVESAREAIQSFLSPDADSRTKDHEGRRIEEIDGGWRLLNHSKYRAIRDQETVRESKRNYINARRAREREAKVEQVVENVDRSRDNAEADTEADIKPKTFEQKADAFARFWSQYPRKKNKGTAEKAFKKLKTDIAFMDSLLDALGKAKRSEAWLKEGGEYIPYPASWLNAKGWLDEEGITLKDKIPCNWSGCPNEGRFVNLAKRRFCDQHFQMDKRGERP